MQIEETKGVIRIEKQIFGKGISNGIGSPQRLSLLLDESTIDKVCETIMYDIKLFFGSGHFVSIKEACKRLNQSNYPLDYKNILLKELEKYFRNGRNFSIENDINSSNNNSKQIKLEKGVWREMQRQTDSQINRQVSRDIQTDQQRGNNRHADG